MNNIRTDYNLFLGKMKKADSSLINTNKNILLSNKSTGDNDIFTYAGNEETKALKNDFDKIKNQQGIIGKVWDGIKNLVGMKSGSKKVEQIIQQAEKGEISLEEAKNAINKYEEGQKSCVDVVADMASGIIAVGAFALAMPTGGASLAIGLTAATAAGAGVKIGIKAGDAAATGKNYNKKDLLYDFATGTVNGLFAPITNGIGASLTKTIGNKLGLKVVQEGAKEAAGQGIRQAAKSVIITQSVDVIGGTVGQRALALGAGMAVDGTLCGASDNMVRAALNDENIVKAGIQGAIGGAIAAPIIGGGFRTAGKAGHALNNKITTRIVLPDGLNTKFKQGQAGDCALLATIDGMLNTLHLPEYLKNL
ncbi:MAG: exodeoxyribonuclease VII small subunit [Candidatus Gastranaerophilales bacterium]|nr:exodeoxyribonuclease VII small subunit [Candidatus Gastranaerophilales bacterium]